MEHIKKDEYFIFGIRAIIEAIEAGKTINKLMMQSEYSRRFAQRIERRN